MAARKRTLVVGGGIGGLCAATALARSGIEVALIEKRPAFDIPGVGLGQPANALRVYDELGVLEEILDSGFVYDHMSVFGPQRDLIYEHRFLLGDDRVPPVCALSRLRLHEILLGAAQRAGVTIRLGTTPTQIRDRKNAVDVELSDGTESTFDLLIGFDGIRSVIRQHLVGSAFVPRPSGYGAWRIQVERRSYVTGMEFLQGVGSKTGAMPLSDELMYVFHIRPQEADVFYDRADIVNLFRQHLSQYGSYVAEVAADLNEESDVVYSPIEPMLLPWPWHHGRVVIGGDAAHTFPPHLTQGAAMAAEDALVLAREVLNCGDHIDAALTRYSQRRYARCAFVYTFATQWMADEQTVRSASDLDVARQELALNGSTRVGVSDRILNMPLG